MPTKYPTLSPGTDRVAKAAAEEALGYVSGTSDDDDEVEYSEDDMMAAKKTASLDYSNDRSSSIDDSSRLQKAKPTTTTTTTMDEDRMAELARKEALGWTLGSSGGEDFYYRRTNSGRRFPQQHPFEQTAFPQTPFEQRQTTVMRGHPTFRTSWDSSLYNGGSSGRDLSTVSSGSTSFRKTNTRPGFPPPEYRSSSFYELSLSNYSQEHHQFRGGGGGGPGRSSMGGRSHSERSSFSSQQSQPQQQQRRTVVPRTPSWEPSSASFGASTSSAKNRRLKSQEGVGAFAVSGIGGGSGSGSNNNGSPNSNEDSYNDEPEDPFAVDGEDAERPLFAEDDDPPTEGTPSTSSPTMYDFDASTLESGQQSYMADPNMMGGGTSSNNAPSMSRNYSSNSHQRGAVSTSGGGAGGGGVIDASGKQHHSTTVTSSMTHTNEPPVNKRKLYTIALLFLLLCVAVGGGIVTAVLVLTQGDSSEDSEDDTDSSPSATLPTSSPTQQQGVQEDPLVIDCNKYVQIPANKYDLFINGAYSYVKTVVRVGAQEVPDPLDCENAQNLALWYATLRFDGQEVSAMVPYVLSHLYFSMGGDDSPQLSETWLEEAVTIGSSISPPCNEKWSGVKCGKTPFDVEELNLREVGLGGNIPTTLGLLSSSLKLLSFYGNNIYGAIPSEVGALSELNFLSVTSNSLQGTLPPQLEEMTNLEHLDLSDNPSLSGRINPEAFPKLIWMDISGTALKGTISDTFCTNQADTLEEYRASCGLNCTCCKYDSECENEGNANRHSRRR